MRISKPYNMSLLAIIAQEKQITYAELKNKYCTPTPSGIISGVNVMFDNDLITLEDEGYIERNDDLITYLHS